MELIETLKQLHTRLPEFGFDEDVVRTLEEYLLFLREREDLLALAQTYHDDIYENGKYTLREVEGLPENDGRSEGLLFAALNLARYTRLEEVLAKRGVPAEVKTGALRTYKELLQKNKNRYGSYGMRGMYRSGIVPYMTPWKYILGRLCFEVAKFTGPYEVYSSKKSGKNVLLALPGFLYMENGKRAAKSYEGKTFEPYLQEENGQIRGFAFGDVDGRLQHTEVTLDTAEYEKVLGTGDDVISVHIPKSGKMSPELVDDAFARADKFFPAYYPEINFKSYVCSSWLLNTDMQEFLSPESNIIKFQNKFRNVMTTQNGYSLYWHVFGVEEFIPLDQLQPANSFQQTLLDRVKSGNPLYNSYGYILIEK